MKQIIWYLRLKFKDCRSDFFFILFSTSLFISDPIPTFNLLSETWKNVHCFQRISCSCTHHLNFFKWLFKLLWFLFTKSWRIIKLWNILKESDSEKQKKVHIENNAQLIGQDFYFSYVIGITWIKIGNFQMHYYYYYIVSKPTQQQWTLIFTGN